MSSIPEPDVSVLVPALNEEATIAEVVQRLLALPLQLEVIVINDGSRDRTGEILSEFGEKIRLITNATPGGKGSAIRSGLSAATGKVVVIQDADLEYSPSEIPSLVQPILEGKADVVYGSRFLHGMRAGMAWPNKIVNRLLAAAVRILFRVKLSDEATCYKAFRRNILLDMDLNCTRFEFCPEVTAKAIRMGHQIVELPISYEPRTKNAGKKIRWTDAPDAFWTLWRYRSWRPRR